MHTDQLALDVSKLLRQAEKGAAGSKGSCHREQHGQAIIPATQEGQRGNLERGKGGPHY